MSRNGSGTYSLPTGNPVVTGTTISSTVHNATMADIAAALTASVAKDGQTTPSANLPMGTYKHTGVGNASARDQYATAGQVQDGALTVLSSVSGADTITATAPVSFSTYAAGQVFTFVAAGTNTGAVTLNINAAGAKSVTKNGTTALASGDIPSGGIVAVSYDGTRFQLLNVYTPPASQAEMEAGSETALRSMSPQRVRQAIDALYTVKFAFAAVNQYNIDTTLTAATDSGKLVLIGGSAGRTITLPLASASPAGTSFLIQSQGATHTISRQGSNVISIPASATSFTLTAGEWAVVTNYNGTDTWVVSASTLKMLGVNQTWQDMTGSRVFSQNYTNQTMKPIQVKVGFNGAGYLSVDGGQADSINLNSTSLHGTVSAIIPPNGNYSVTCSYTMDFWMELR